MDKLLCERPRWGRSVKAPKGRPARDDSLLPKHRGMRWVSDGAVGHRFPGENLAPLKRFIRKQVGRPWNKVFSEMREHIKPGNTVQEHLMTHFQDYIALHVDRVEASHEAPCGLKRRSSQRWRVTPLAAGDLYVDPDDGIIKVAKRRCRAKAEPRPPQGRKISDSLYIQPFDGVWYGLDLARYRILLVPTPDGGTQTVYEIGGQRCETATDPIEGAFRGSDPDQVRRLAARYGPGKVAVRKRQLSRRELKSLGLANQTCD